MTTYDVVIATFKDHRQADTAVRALMKDHFDMKAFSVIGKGYHTEEKVIGLYTVGDKMKLWGKYGAFWGGLWGFMLGGVFLTIPMLGPIVVLGPLALMIVSAVEGAVAGGAVSALVAALVSFGLPKQDAIHYETAIQADGFVVIGHGSPEEMARAKGALSTFHPDRIDSRQSVTPLADVAPTA